MSSLRHRLGRVLLRDSVPLPPGRVASSARTGLAALILCCSFLYVFEGTAQRGPSSDNGAQPPPSAPHDQYAGTAACLPCHKEKTSSFIQTAHYLTSQPPGKDSILGSFAEGQNILMIADPRSAGEDPGLYFKMEARAGGFFQTSVIGWPDQSEKRTERIDVVVGSGVRGQTYLYWRGDKLFELPVSYWSDGHKWINSPGYKNGTADFSRAVIPRCLECHATFIRQLSPDPVSNVYNKSSLVVGIQCETCHGPSKAHVDLESKVSSGTPVASSILNPARFSRDRGMDLCALCHNGLRSQQIAPAFSYIPGEPLSKFLQPDPTDLPDKPNVHGNQVGLLEKSRCYQSSPNLNCSTCHDVHAPEKSAASYSVHCLACHTASSCGMFTKMGSKIADNCIDCHMPVEQTSAVVSDTAGDLLRPRMRNHWIKIYSGESPSK